MQEFGKIKSLNLREIWPNEATDFTPWMAENIQRLGECLGMDLEIEDMEATVGNFYLDILAKDLGSSRIVIIENQLTETDHDHLGKLLTYAGGLDASVVIWISKTIRDEHRQALEWLNEKTDSYIDFFGVVVEVIQIDQSKPAFVFKPVVYPNQWQKNQRRSNILSPRAEAYRIFFQELIDKLRTKHKFTGAKVGQPQNWYAFSTGKSGFVYSVSFTQDKKVRAELYLGSSDRTMNKACYDEFIKEKNHIETEFQNALEWDRGDDKQASRIAIYRNGSIDENTDVLKDIQEWSIQQLLKFKKVFSKRIGNLK